MHDIAFLKNLVEHYYQIQVISLDHLSSNTGKYLYRVEQANGQRWLLRLVQDDDSIFALANVLLFLEDKAYSAERIIRTVEHTAVGGVEDWYFLMTTFLTGTSLDPSPATFFLLGATLGRLHALKVPETRSLPIAEMLPERELAYATQQLTAVASHVPQHLRPRYEMFESALASIERFTDLPPVLIHNDCHPANALYTGPEQITLIDWEGAGLGPALIDVAFLLVNTDAAAPWEPLPSEAVFHLDEARISATIEGYCQHHSLTRDELDRLPDAILFRSIVFGACSFATAINIDGNADTPQWWWARYIAAEKIADKARSYFARYHSSGDKSDKNGHSS